MLFALFFGCSLQMKGQVEKTQLDVWIEAGVALHDQGDFDGAILEFDKVLEINPGHFVAGAEKAMSLFARGELKSSIALGERLISEHPEESGLAQVYAQTGNALDLLGQPEEAVAFYRRGIARFPDFYLLHYNLGIAYLSQGKSNSGLGELLKAVKSNPVHPGSHHALGIALARQNRRMESILALLRFSVLETGTTRSIQATALLTQLLEPAGPRPEEAVDRVLKGYSHMDSLLQVEVLQMERRSFRKAQGLGRANAVEEDLFILSNLSDVLERAEKNGEFKDEFSKIFLPFLFQVEEAGLLETLVYMAHSNTGKRGVADWLTKHFEQVELLVGLVFYEN